MDLTFLENVIDALQPLLQLALPVIWVAIILKRVLNILKK